jgi:hypothetical protein
MDDDDDATSSSGNDANQKDSIGSCSNKVYGSMYKSRTCSLLLEIGKYLK